MALDLALHLVHPRQDDLELGADVAGRHVRVLAELDLLLPEADILFLKHDSSIIQTVIQPCVWFMEEPSQFPVGQTVQSLTCSIVEKLTV